MPALSSAHRKLLGVLLLVFLALGGAMILRSLLQKENPAVVTPALALQQLNAKSLYYNANARSWLAAQRSDLLTEEDLKANSERVRAMVQAVQNPRLFRQLDRQHRFDTLFLVGDPSQYRPLLEHLLESKDWGLAYLDHTSLVYKRNPPARWEPEAFDAVRESLADASSKDRAKVLSQAAGKMIAVREAGAARKLLEEAEGMHSKSPDVWSAWAQYRLAMGQWKEAVSAADRALEIDDDLPAALASKAQALYAMKYFSDAYGVSRKLMDTVQEDPALLFYHAKIAHEARAYTDEIRTLEKLVKMAEQQQRPASGYRVYLAQAYASDGQAQPALEQFTQALADPELPDEQRKFAVEGSAMIRNRTGQ